MPAEMKRMHPGVYILFLGNQVVEEELAEATQAYADAAIEDGLDEYVVVVDSILTMNPLGVGRMLPKYHRPGTTHYIVVSKPRDGAVLAERLAQKIPDVIIEPSPNQIVAVARARAIRGLTHYEGPDHTH